MDAVVIFGKGTAWADPLWILCLPLEGKRLTFTPLYIRMALRFGSSSNKYYHNEYTLLDTKEPRHMRSGPGAAKIIEESQLDSK